ncbi:MAG TPA: T9SS type A sorting domain-containing protein [Bacteroidota bacterium]|nr:T9SS type A sorting domain-containing protein [Bacteroidota bacterium]
MPRQTSGLHYNALDSLISYADSLQQGNYTAGSWAALTTALTSAQNAMTQEYSVSVSADTALAKALSDLSAAVGGLVVTGVRDEEGNSPKTFVLNQNYPNPFNPSTTISYQLPVHSFVSLKVYNELGMEVARLVDREEESGEHSVQWNAKKLSSGVYFCELRAGGYHQIKTMLLLK